MKKLVFLFLWGATALHAAGSKTPGWGVGVMVGDPTGLTAKYWLDKTRAVDVGLGFNDLSLHADLLWHRRDLFPKPKEGHLAAVYGLGGKVEDNGDDTVAGLRLVGGAAYYFPRHPVELYFELVPVIEVSPKLDWDWDGGLGLRVYFR